jgi:membrane protein DedA with SNARE-associated domain
VTDWAIGVLDALGAVGLAFVIALENLFPPIPSEIVLPLAGFLVERGRLTFVIALVASTAGSLGGALILYGLGAWLGWERVVRFAQGRGRWLMLSEKDLRRADRWFERRGHEAVLIARVIPGARSLISIPAGASSMGLRRFVVYTSLGSCVWNALFITLGWLLGDRWRAAGTAGEIFSYVAVGALVLAFVVFVVRRRRARSGVSV